MGGTPSAGPFSIRSRRRAAVSVAVWSRFAIYAIAVGQTNIALYEQSATPYFVAQTLFAFGHSGYTIRRVDRDLALVLRDEFAAQRGCFKVILIMYMLI